jgi:hypothetical protein
MFQILDGGQFRKFATYQVEVLEEGQSRYLVDPLR